MLEMLNPSPTDIMRFAASTLSFRLSLARQLKKDPTEAANMVMERFCTPPTSAQRAPNLARLKADTQNTLVGTTRSG